MISKHFVAKTLIRILHPLLKVLFRPITKRHLTVFLFHDVTDSPSIFQTKALNYTTNENFWNCIKWISKNYKIVGINQIESPNTENKKPIALITFDDAWAGQFRTINQLDELIPITFFTNLGTSKTGIDFAALQNYDLKKVPTFANEVDFDPDEKSSFRAWQGEVIDPGKFNLLSCKKNVTLANHGYFHYSSTSLADEEFLKNVKFNETSLKELGFSEKYFAFPFGKPISDFTLSQIEILKQNGYKLIFAADSKLNKLPIGSKDFISRIHFSPHDSRDSDFWWATHKCLIPRKR